MVLCRFYRDLILWDELTTLIEATTGWVWDKDYLEVFANHVTQETRAYNLREGLDASPDTLPQRFFKEKPAEGAALTQEELETMLAEYNCIRQERSAKWAGAK